MLRGEGGGGAAAAFRVGAECGHGLVAERNYGSRGTGGVVERFELCVQSGGGRELGSEHVGVRVLAHALGMAVSPLFNRSNIGVEWRIASRTSGMGVSTWLGVLLHRGLTAAAM